MSASAAIGRLPRHVRTMLSRALLTAFLLVALTATSASAAVVSRGPAAYSTYASDSTTSVVLAAPTGVQPGDVVIATLGVGSSGAKSQPTITPPPGWALVNRTNQASAHALAVYSHVYATGEASYTWTTSFAVGGTAFAAAFGGVDALQPVDASAGRTVTKKSSSIATPSITTTTAGDMLVAAYYGYRGSGGGTTWKPPSGMTELGDASNSGSRSGTIDGASQSAAGNTGAKTATASAGQDFAIATLTALRPGSSSGSTTAPVISALQAGAISPTTATITWTTDQPADSQVEFGLTSSYGSATQLDSTAVTSHSQYITGLSPNTVYHYRVRSRNAAGLLSVSDDATFQTSTGGAVPLIVDTDIFSDADDVGALASAFGLQLRGEARVVAIGVNTRTSRPAVATNSWKCAAAITSFYNSFSVPIGTAIPNNGTALNDPDFIGPCSQLAPASTPVPESAVTVFRRALAAQPDGSVVIASAGYFGNLSALLDSPADSISPLTGRQLVAQKVSSLVAMAGGYPQRSGENNLIGDPASAQNVADNWPTKIIWSGYEVGDQVHTGQTIPSVHPANSPVRVSYEAFVKPGNWIYSYDLTAVYHAIRPSDSLLSEVGPGTNKVDSSGGNVFTMGSGNQYYLTLSDASMLDSSIEALLDTLPTSSPPPPDTTPPAISAVGAGSIDASSARVSWTTDEPATTQVEYGTTSSYGSSTTADSTLATSHAQTLSGLSAGTLYHYRVRSTDAAGNSAVSGDFTFTTAAADTTPPAISAVTAGSVDASSARISWTTDEPATTQVEYGTTSSYGSSTSADSTLVTGHAQTLSGLAAGTLYHYRVRSTDAAGNGAVSGDFTFTTAAAPPPPTGLNDNFDSGVIDPSIWTVTASGSSVAAANQELEITHAPGLWTKGAVTSASSFDATGHSVQVQVKRAANDGNGGSTYGETSIFLMLDTTHYAEFFIGGSALTAWIDKGGSSTNLTPSWPRYNATNMQWLRFREANGTLYWEYASGATSPGPWSTLMTTTTPFSMQAMKLQLAAGSSVNVTDTAKFDNVATY